VNLGRRQASRLRGENVIDAEFERARSARDRSGAEPEIPGPGLPMREIHTATAIHRNASSIS